MSNRHVELKILYRINDIDYKIVQLTNRTHTLINNTTKIDLPEPNYNQDLIIFLQRNEDPPHQIHVGFYNDRNSNYFTQMFDSYMSAFAFISTIKTNILIIKNIKHDWLHLKHIADADAEAVEWYCLESFMKHRHCLPVFHNGKPIHRRFRIPGIDEYLSRESMELSAKTTSNEIKYQMFFKTIKDTIYQQICTLRDIIYSSILYSQSSLEQYIEYNLYKGCECNNIAFIFEKFTVRKLTEESWNHTKFPIHFVSIDQFHKMNQENEFELVIFCGTHKFKYNILYQP
jgi:hypothetical protein